MSNPPTEPVPHLPFLAAALGSNKRFLRQVLFSTLSLVTALLGWSVGTYFLGWPDAPTSLRYFAVGSVILYVALRTFTYLINYALAQLMFLGTEYAGYLATTMVGSGPMVPTTPPGDRKNVFSLFGSDPTNPAA